MINFKKIIYVIIISRFTKNILNLVFTRKEKKMSYDRKFNVASFHTVQWEVSPQDHLNTKRKFNKIKVD